MISKLEEGGGRDLACLHSHVEHGRATRKACDFCTARKKRCDGKGDPSKPCTPCKQRGIPCRYSPRQVSVGKRRHPEGAKGDELSLQRQPFRASPATGLVGHIENMYLASFQENLQPFLAATRGNTILGGMTDVMLVTPVQGRVEYSNPSLVSVFWGAVALGSLIGCAPREKTEMYVNKARGCLNAALQSRVAGHRDEFLQALHLMTNMELMRGNDGAAIHYNAIAASCIVTDTTAAEANIDPGEVQVMFADYVAKGSADHVPREQLIKAADRAKQSLPILKKKEDLQEVQTQALRVLLKGSGFIYSELGESRETYLLMEEIFKTVYEIMAANVKLRKCLMAYVPICLCRGCTSVICGQHNQGMQLLDEGISVLCSTPGIIAHPLVLHAVHIAVLVTVYLKWLDLYERIRGIHNIHYLGFYLPDSRTGDPFNIDEFMSEPMCTRSSCIRVYSVLRAARTTITIAEEEKDTLPATQSYDIDKELGQVLEQELGIGADHILELLEDPQEGGVNGST
ncbi:unnamed protein product [Chrysoparadoxa australica]